MRSDSVSRVTLISRSTSGSYDVKTNHPDIYPQITATNFALIPNTVSVGGPSDVRASGSISYNASTGVVSFTSPGIRESGKGGYAYMDLVMYYVES